MSTSSDYMEARHCRNALVYKGCYSCESFSYWEVCYAPFNFYLTMTRFASKVSQRKKFPVQLSMQNIHHCNQWNTSFLLIRYNGFANAYFDDTIVQKPIFTQFEYFFSINCYGRLRSAWASAQSDQSLFCALNGKLRAQCFFRRTAKTLIRLGGCAGWSESSLGAQSRIHRKRNRGYMEESYRQHIFMIFLPDERS